MLKPMSVEEDLWTEEQSPVERENAGGFVYPLHGHARAQAGASRTHTANTVRAAFSGTTISSSPCRSGVTTRIRDRV